MGPRSLAVFMLLAAISPAQEQPKPCPEVPFIPSPEEVVDTMLRLANVTKADIVYDLGCGDGRIVIAAARRYGAHGVGIDIDPDRVKEARFNAKNAGVEDLARFREGDLFDADIHEATVVTLYLLPAVNLKVRPKLLRELRPGTRIVSHSFDMGDWKPEKQEDTTDGRTVYLWIVPDRKSPSKR